MSIMEPLFWPFVFIVSCGLLYFSGGLVLGSLIRIAKFLGWKEFVVAFFAMAFASSLPNFFVGISSSLHEIPQLSFGDIVGGNVIDLTLAIGLAVLFSKREIPAKGRTVQTTLTFTIIAAILPLILIIDGVLSRIDGILLITIFIFYLSWLFSKKERFSKIYDGEKLAPIEGLKIFVKDTGKLILGTIFLLTAAEGIVRSASFFAKSFNLSLALIGILIVGLGNTLPEIYFSVALAKKGETWMILGNLMGSVIISATLVLGSVALICPIEIIDFSSLALARAFLIISALSFFLFVRTGRRVRKGEALLLIGIYIAFILAEILKNGSNFQLP